MERSFFSRAFFVATTSVLVSACGSDDGPRWIALAGGFESAPALPTGVVGKAIDGRAIEVVREEDGLWCRVALDAESWEQVWRPGYWMAPLPILGLGRTRYLLETDEMELSPPAGRILKRGFELAPNTYYYHRGSLYLRLAEGVRPPEEAHVRALVDWGELDEEGAVWLRGRRFAGKGLPVWSGSSLERTVDIPPGSALRFGVGIEQALSEELVSEEPTVFRVLLDGERVVEASLAGTPEGSQAWHSAPLPPEGRRGARLAFEVEGPFAYTFIASPVIGPADVGSFAARPWPSRESIVVFLADTFRADNLALYGGPQDVAPALNRFAAESTAFRRAWSVGTYTLTAHASLFSGLFPHQTSADSLVRALPEELETIAERLQRFGYRTGAITDSGVLSQNVGMHQGFEWFDEHRSDLPDTIERARAFLDADDGRPTFLFVQTYRTHSPYEAEETTYTRRYRSPWDPQEDEGEYGELMEQLRVAENGSSPEDVERVAAELLRLYRAGATELDRGFDSLWRDLGERGFPEAGYLVFTSDHGEAFLEHGQLRHKGHVFEEQIRIPLLIAGPDLGAKTVDHAASLVDLPPTLAEMAGIPFNDRWLGTSLLDLRDDRTVFAFECGRRGGKPTEDSTLAVIDGERKLIGFEKDRELAKLWAAFDLDADPGETTSLLEGDESAWAQELFERTAPAVQVLLTPLVGAQDATLDAGHIEDLRALGYAVDG